MMCERRPAPPLVSGLFFPFPHPPSNRTVRFTVRLVTEHIAVRYFRLIA